MSLFGQFIIINFYVVNLSLFGQLIVDVYIYIYIDTSWQLFVLIDPI